MFFIKDPNNCKMLSDVLVYSKLLGKNLRIAELVISRNGVFAYIKTKEYGSLRRIHPKCAEIAAILKDILQIKDTELFLFVVDGNSRHLVVDLRSNSAEEVEAEWINRKVNRILSSSDFLFEKERYEEIERKSEILSLREMEEEKEKVGEDGEKYVKKGEKWVKVSHRDPDADFDKLAFGGIFGLHYFSLKRIRSGLFYFFTCGGFGMCWLMDILQAFVGIRQAEKGAIYSKLKEPKKAALKLLVAVPLAVGIVLAYIWLTSHGFEVLFNVLSDISATLAENIQ